MTTHDHPFVPLLLDPLHCMHCRDLRPAPQHFGEHTGPVVPVPGFAVKALEPRPRKAKRSAPARCPDCGATGWTCGHGNPLNGINCIAAGAIHMNAPVVPPRKRAR